MRDHRGLFLRIPGTTRPSKAGPIFRNDIPETGIGSVMCCHEHDEHVPLTIISFVGW